MLKTKRIMLEDLLALSNVFAFLGVSIKGEHNKEKSDQKVVEVSKEKIHTPRHHSLLT